MTLIYLLSGLVLLAFIALGIKLFGRTQTVIMPSGTHYTVVGELKRQKENMQFFVIDPADKTMTWVNSTDDMYEDADRKIWRLV